MVDEPQGNRLTEVARVDLQARDQVGSADAWVIAPLHLYVVNDISYVRDSASSWNDWATTHQLAAGYFNWPAVFSFHARSDTLVLAIEAGDRACPEALMLVRDSYVVRCDSGHRAPLSYVGFLEIAPWNRTSVPEGPRHRGVGTAMLRAACDLSLQSGHAGRVGLHSLATAEGFYRRLGFTALDCANEYHELYFELNEGAAQNLLTD